jgi:DNA-binding transcriptional LysR family regulator
MSQIEQVDIRRLDMTLLVVFAELMTRRNLRAVGERLGLTQSAVSHALKRLRDIFDHELFIRRPHGVQPTARALELEPLVAEILRLAGEALAAGDQFDPAKVKRTLQIGMLDYGATLLGPGFLTYARRAAPGLSVAFRFFGREAALNSLAAGEIDLALGVFPKLRADFVREQLFQDDFVVVARADHPRITAELTLAQYLAEEHVVVSQTGALRGIVDRTLSRRGASRRVVLALPSFLAALAIATETDFLATLPRRFTDQFKGRLPLRSMKPPFEQRPFTISAVRHRREAQNPLITWTVERLRET